MVGSHVDASLDSRSNCYALQVASATGAFATVRAVDAAELVLWRIERLQAAVNKLTAGNVSAFGAMLGYKDGAFVRQMLSGVRPVSEKTIRKIEALPNMDEWFEPGAEPLHVFSQIRSAVNEREIPDHVLRTILEMLKGFPPKRKAA